MFCLPHTLRESRVKRSRFGGESSRLGVGMGELLDAACSKVFDDYKKFPQGIGS